MVEPKDSKISSIAKSYGLFFSTLKISTSAAATSSGTVKWIEIALTFNNSKKMQKDHSLP